LRRQQVKQKNYLAKLQKRSKKLKKRNSYS
jgi:hypothetical protein